MKFLTSIIMTLLFTATTLQAKIIETNRIEDVMPFIDQECWLLVDLDNCMFESAQALGHANWFYDELQKRMQKGMSRDEAIRDAYPLWIRTQRICKVKTLEKAFVPTLLMLQKQGITMMGLTHRQPSVADATTRQVESLGFNFITTAPSQDSFIIPSNSSTLYLQGILFVSDYNKKIDIFEPFLEMIDQKPKKIIFIDDKRKNVEELDALTKHGIEYLGVHYNAIENCKPVYDRKIAEFQYKYFDQILSNEAAMALMERGLE